MKNNNILPEHIAGSDPLVKLLQIKPFVFAILLLIGGALFQFGLSAVFGYLRPAPGIARSGISDYYNMVNFLFIIPALGYHYLAQPARIAGVYQNVLVLLRSDMDISENDIQEWYKNPLPWISGFIIAAIVIWLGVADNLNKLGTFWYAANGLTIAIIQLFRALTFYMLMTTVGRHLVTAYRLNKVMSHADLPLTITSTRRDISLKSITNYSFSFATIGAIAGLSLGLQPVLSAPSFPEYYLFVLLYLMLIPIGFFLPLWQTHKRLQAIKQDALTNLRVSLQDEYQILLAERENVSNQQMARVKALYETVHLVEKSSEWPFQEYALYRLVSTVTFPFLFAILDWFLTLMDVSSWVFTN